MRYIPLRILPLLLIILTFIKAHSQNDDVQLIYDISYSTEAPDDTLRQLNLAIPRNTPDAPLLIWIGGGAWSYVDKDVEMELGAQFAKEGITMASIGHRLSPATWRSPELTDGVTHPAHIRDVAEAVRWLVDHAGEYGYDPENIFIGGFSSGAHLALLLALDEQYLKAQGLDASIITGIIPVSGAYDLENYREVMESGDQPELAELHVDAVFGEGTGVLKNASPISYLDHLNQPLLIISDHSLFRYTALLEDRLLETNFNKYTVVYAHGYSHGELWRDMSRNQESIYRGLIQSFIITKKPGQPITE